MARYLRTNTATIVTIGPFLDFEDGVTLEAAIAEGADEKITFVVDANNGGAPTVVLDMVATNASTDNDVTDLGTSGYYGLELTAANVNYVGRAVLSITNAAVHCPVFHEFTILPAQVFDSLVLGAGTDLLDVHVTELSNDAITAAAIANGAIDAATFAAGAIDAAAIANAAIDAATFAAGAIDAAAIAAGAIDNATFAADVGSTAYATNIIALAADKAIANAALATAAAVADVPTVAELEARTLVAAGYASPTNITAGVITTVTNLTNLPAAAATAAQLPTLALTTGTVLTSGGANTASAFYTDLAGVDNFWNDALILITSGALAGQVKEIGDFADVNGVVTLTSGQAFTGIPADGVTFCIINR